MGGFTVLFIGHEFHLLQIFVSSRCAPAVGVCPPPHDMDASRVGDHDSATNASVFVLPINVGNSVAAIKSHLPEMIERVQSDASWLHGTPEYHGYHHMFGDSGEIFGGLYGRSGTALSYRVNGSNRTTPHLNRFRIATVAFRRTTPRPVDRREAARWSPDFRTVLISVEDDLREIALARELLMDPDAFPGRDPNLPHDTTIVETVSLEIKNPPSLAERDPARRSHPHDWSPPSADPINLSFSWNTKMLGALRAGIYERLESRRAHADAFARGATEFHQGFFVSVNCDIGPCFLYVGYACYRSGGHPKMVGRHLLFFTANRWFLYGIRMQMVNDAASVMELFKAVRNGDVRGIDPINSIDYKPYIDRMPLEAALVKRRALLERHGIIGIPSLQEMHRMAIEDADTIPDPAARETGLTAYGTIESEPNDLLRYAKIVCYYDRWMQYENERIEAGRDKTAAVETRIDE